MVGRQHDDLPGGELMARRLELDQRGIADLLGIYGQVLEVLNAREVIRSANAPTGDYAEWLVHRALGGQLQPNSNKSADLIVRKKRFQIKARVLSDPERSGERQLSSFRSWDFDEAVIVMGPRLSSDCTRRTARPRPRYHREAAAGRCGARRLNRGCGAPHPRRFSAAE